MTRDTIYRLAAATMFIGCLIFIDRYLSANDSTWSFFISVWPMWLAVLSMGIALCFMVAPSYLKTIVRRELDDEYQANYEAYRQSVKHDFEDEKNVLDRQKEILAQQQNTFYQEYSDGKKKLKKELKKELKELEIKSQKLDAATEEAIKAKADLERVILEKTAENEQFKQSALTARIMLERFQRKKGKQEDTQA